METVGGLKTGETSEGIPQGDVLSPLVFLLYTTPLFELYVEGSMLLQFADDLCLIAWSSNAMETTEILQKATNGLMKLIGKLDMDVCPSKCKAIWFNSEMEIYNPIVKLKGNVIGFESSVKFLGLFLDEKLSYQRHIRELVSAMERKINIIKMFSGSKWGGHPETLVAVLKSVVRGKLEYGCTIYGSANQRWLNKITVTYNKGLRICLRSLKTTPVIALEVEAKNFQKVSK